MVRCNWLFESDVFDEGISRIVEEVRRQGMRAEICHYYPYQSGQTYLDIFDKEDCVFFYGSLGFADQIAREACWNPGIIYTKDNYKCSHYYPHFGKHHLADSYAMIPYGDFKRCSGELYDKFGIHDTIFVRPDRGDKPFTGQLIEKRHFDKDYKYIGYYGLRPYDMIIISEPRDIETEWRFIIADKKIVGCSRYGHNKEDMILRALLDAYVVAERICREDWQPDRAYSLDVCKTRAGNYHLLEIGTVSCSGYYACDVEPIVREISRIAEEEWAIARGLD